MGEVNFASHPLSIYVLTFRLSCLAGCSREEGGMEGWREGRKERVSVCLSIYSVAQNCRARTSIFSLGGRTIAMIPAGRARNKWKDVAC